MSEIHGDRGSGRRRTRTARYSPQTPRPVVSVVVMSESYWRGAAEDEAMQDEHGFLWQAMLNTIDIDLTGRRVLDAGCNRGGFLRLLVDEFRIAEGYGYDPASGAIEDARRLIGQRPLTFETGDTVPDGWAEFDAAFSHEVLYVLHDLASHAVAMFVRAEARGAVLRGDGGPRREPDDVRVARLGRERACATQAV